jgi:hypothetical protein
MKFVSETRQSLKSHMTVTTVLALAILGCATINRNDPISVAPPKVAKANTSMSLSLVIVADVIPLSFTNVKKS